MVGGPDSVPDFLKEPEEPVLLDSIGVSGDYVIDGYDNNKNDWHFVKIEMTGSGVYTWSNRAGVSWTLRERADDPDHLDVGEDCPYYKSGHTSAKLRRDAKGQITAIQGPGNEWYDKQTPEPIEEPMVGGPESVPDFLKEPKEPEVIEEPIIGGPDSVPDFLKEPEELVPLDAIGVSGDYVIDGYDNNKNDWHFVKIEKTGMTVYRWSNRAGVSWTLNERADDPDHLDVGEDCPYYKSGHTVAKLRRDAEGNVTGIQGPGNEWYLKEPELIEEPIIGGPDSIPDFLKEPEVIEEPMVGGPDSVPDFLKEPKEPEVIEEPEEKVVMPHGFAGEYVIDGYDGNKNDWHYVTIEKGDGVGGYRWTNRAGVSWSLFHKWSTDDHLDVGKECPYYNSGHTRANVRFDAEGNVTAIQGPGNEWYLKEPEVIEEPELIIDEPEKHIEFPPEEVDDGKPDWAPKWDELEEGEVTVGGWPDEKPEVKEPEEEKKEEPQSGPIVGIAGEYVIDGYDNNKNDWHYVTIKKNRAGGYRWINRAGVEWTLTKKADSKFELDVGPECPYYE